MMARRGVSTRSALLLVILLLLACVGVVAICLLSRGRSSSVPSVNDIPIDPCDTQPVGLVPTSIVDDSNRLDESELATLAETGEKVPATDPCEPALPVPGQDRPVTVRQSVRSDDAMGGMIRGVLVDIEGNSVDGYVTLGHAAGAPNAEPASFFALAEPDYRSPEGLLGCARDVSDTLGRRFLWQKGNLNEELTIVLEPYASIIGRVVGVDRKPVSSVRLDLQTQMLNGSWRGGDAALDIPVIDDEGYLLFDRVPVGLRVKVTAHRGTLTGQSRRLELTPGETADVGEIVMTGRRPGAGTIQGCITDETGRPLADRSIRMRIGRNAQWLRTDAGGYFVMTEMPKGRPLAVTLEVDPYGSWSRTATPDDFACDFRLCPQGYDVVGKEALPLFMGKWFHHAPTTLEELRGRVVLLAFRNFDRDVDPGLARICDLQNEYAAQKLLVIAIYNHLPSSSPLAEDIVSGHLASFFEGAPMAGLLDADPSLVADLMPAERPAGAGAGATHWMYQVHTRPAFFLIDKAGTVRHCTGNDTELREWVERLLGE